MRTTSPSHLGQSISLAIVLAMTSMGVIVLMLIQSNQL